jgi:hypothetical protein
MRPPYGDDEPGREIEISMPDGLDAAELEALEYGGEPRRLPKRTLTALALVVGGISLVVTVVVPHERAVQQRHELASYDQLLTLSAAGEASVERAVSQTRDVVQYAEPLLNSPQTTPATRTTLYNLMITTARQGQTGIDLERQRLQSKSLSHGGSLRTAQEATIAYLTGWSAVFADAGGDGAVLPASSDDLTARRVAARTALEAAAPDPTRAAQAGIVLGTDS